MKNSLHHLHITEREREREREREGERERQREREREHATHTTQGDAQSWPPGVDSLSRCQQAGGAKEGGVSLGNSCRINGVPVEENTGEQEEGREKKGHAK